MVERLIDMMDMVFGLNCTLGMSITHGIDPDPVDWHVNMITHLFVGRYAWYKRLWF
jgi:hypothetical protein